MQFMNILILVGAIQGFICTALLFHSDTGKKLSNRLLGILIFLFSLACLNIFLMLTGFRYHSSFGSIFADVFPMLIVMPVGPLIYFYVRALTEDNLKIDARHRYHFLLAIIDLIPYAAGAIMIAGAATTMMSDAAAAAFRNFIDEYQVQVDVVRWVSITTYVYFAWQNLPPAGKGQTISPGRKWLRQFLFVITSFQTVWLFHLIPYLLPAFRDNLMEWVNWYPLYIPLAAIVYWLGINGYLRNRETHEFASRPIRKESSNIAVEIHEGIKAKLLSAMESERMFLDPELTVDKLSKCISVPAKSVSATLNQFIGKSFNEFINEYRVNELKKRLADDVDHHLTIMGFALECGFNSQATMQRAFRTVTGKSPKEYVSDLKMCEKVV